MVEIEEQEAQLPLEGAGGHLARARASAGKSLADIAQLTRISERQLAAIEAADYAAFPSRAYPVGFARTYAKAVGLDSKAIAAMVIAELSQLDPDNTRHMVPAFEPGDPARLPGRNVVWYAAIGLVLVLIVGFLAWPSLYSPGGSLPSILPSATPRAAMPSAAPAQPIQASGPVVFTATRDKVWVRFLDGNGQQLLQKELAAGESWTVPEAAGAVTLTTARPDGLAVTIGGRPVPPLAESEQVVRDFPVTAAALLARGIKPAVSPSPPVNQAITAAQAAPRPKKRTDPIPRSQPGPAAAVSEQVAVPAAPTSNGTTAATADSEG